MQPMEYSVCHSVKEEAYSYSCGKTNSIVGVSHVAAPVHEDERAEQDDDEKLACAMADCHTPVEAFHESVFLFVEAEEYCQKNEGVKELDDVKRQYHTLVFICWVIALRHGIELPGNAVIEQIVITG